MKAMQEKDLRLMNNQKGDNMKEKIIRTQVSITEDELEILETWEELPASSCEDAIVNGIIKQVKENK